MFYGSPMPLIVVTVATLSLVFALSAAHRRRVGPVRDLQRVGRPALLGVLLIYAQESVYAAFFSTAGMFAVMALHPARPDVARQLSVHGLIISPSRPWWSY